MSIDYAKLLAEYARFLPRGPIPARVEVGTGVLAQLRLAALDDDGPLPPALMPGIPVFEKPDMPVFAWRLYDTDGNLIASHPPNLAEADHSTAMPDAPQTAGETSTVRTIELFDLAPQGQHRDDLFYGLFRKYLEDNRCYTTESGFWVHVKPGCPH